MTDKIDTGTEAVERLIGKHGLLVGYAVQDGSKTNAPAVVWADADYELGDGTCGLHENQKPANEPAIPYVRIDALIALSAKRDTLQARVTEAEARVAEARREALEEAAKVADSYNQDPYPQQEYDVGWARSAECVASAIRALIDAPKPEGDT